MKRKPWPLIVLALLHLFAPIGNILINSYLTHIAPLDYLKALLLTSHLFYKFIFFGLPILSASLIYHCKKWSYIIYIALMAFPFIYSYVSWVSEPSLTIGLIIGLSYLANIGLVGYFFLPAVRKVYFDPKLRWWETKPRYAADYQSEIFVAENKYAGNIKNISENGLFVESKDNFSLNKTLKIQFKVGDDTYLFNGEAVYHRRSAPTGYGVKLQNDSADRKKILSLITKLDGDGTKISSRAPGPEDSFVFWAKSLFKTKKAWIPQAPRS